MILSVGETLIDIFPAYSRIGGAPLNFTAHLTSFGLEASIATRIGNDPEGAMIEKLFREYGLDTRFLQKDSSRPTGKVNITHDGKGGHSFSIEKNAAYDFIEYPEIPEKDKNLIRCLYFGTLIQRTAGGRRVVRRLAGEVPENAIVFFDINLRPGCYSGDVVLESLGNCTVLKVNDEEIGYLVSLTGVGETGDKAVFRIMEKYDIKTVAVTLGKDGARLYTGGRAVSGKSKAIPSIKDTVGAGDAFSAALVKGLLEGEAPEGIVEDAVEFASGICGIEGALPPPGEKSLYSNS